MDYVKIRLSTPWKWHTGVKGSYHVTSLTVEKYDLFWHLINPNIYLPCDISTKLQRKLHRNTTTVSAQPYKNKDKKNEWS